MVLFLVRGILMVFEAGMGIFMVMFWERGILMVFGVGHGDLLMVM